MVDALHAPAGRRLVDHVVVVQRPEVDELDRHCPGDDVLRDGLVAPGGVAGAQRQRRPDPLATSTDEVGGDVGEERITGPNRAPEGFLDPDQIVGQPGEPLDHRHGRTR